MQWPVLLAIGGCQVEIRQPAMQGRRERLANRQ